VGALDGLWFVDLLEAEDAEATREALAQLSPEKPNGLLDCRLRSSRGDFWVRWRLTLSSDGLVIAVGRDVSSDRKTAIELRSKESFLRSIIENEPECVKLVSRDGALLDMNAAGLQMIGASSRTAAIGLSIYDLVVPEDRERFREFNERVCSGMRGELNFDIVSMDSQTRRSMQTVATPLVFGTESERCTLRSHGTSASACGSRNS
jgi:PAS domain S-box-containing protein